MKTTLGVSQSLQCRADFDGTDAELVIGLGDVGGSLGGLTEGGPESLTLEIGPQLGFQGDLTQTWSYTGGDLGHLVGRIIHGPISE